MLYNTQEQIGTAVGCWLFFQSVSTPLSQTHSQQQSMRALPAACAVHKRHSVTSERQTAALGATLLTAACTAPGRRAFLRRSPEPGAADAGLAGDSYLRDAVIALPHITGLRGRFVVSSRGEGRDDAFRRVILQILEVVSPVLALHEGSGWLGGGEFSRWFPPMLCMAAACADALREACWHVASWFRRHSDAVHF